MTLCSVCGVREAVYYRSYSGERLCQRCLLRAVERLVSRSLSAANPRPTSTFLIPLSSFAPSSSLAMARVLWGAERRFPRTKVVLAVPDFMADRVLLQGLPEGLSLEVFEVRPPPPGSADLISCIRYDRAWSLRAAESLGADIIVLPLSRTDLTLLTLEALLSGDRDALSDALRSLSVGGISVVAGAAELEREALAALEFLSGFADVKPMCSLKIASKGVLMSIFGRPEVDYGGLKIPEVLFGQLKDRPRCSICGGLSPGGVCTRCKVMGLEALSVKRLGQLHHPGPGGPEGPS